MAGPYCPRCQTSVKLEQDGKSCSNCGRILVIPAPTPPPPPPRKAKKPTRTRVTPTKADSGLPPTTMNEPTQAA